MYKLAEFRKKLEQKNSFIQINQSSPSRYEMMVRKISLMELAKDQSIDIEERLKSARKAAELSARIRRLDLGCGVSQISSMMNRINEMYNKPR